MSILLVITSVISALIVEGVIGFYASQQYFQIFIMDIQ